MKRSTAIASSRSTISRSAARRKRTPGCCSKALPDKTLHLRRHHALARRAGAAQPRRARRRLRRARRPLQARPRRSRRLAERRHAARDAAALGGHGRLGGQPARAVSRQPVHDRRGVRRQRHRLDRAPRVRRSPGPPLDGWRRRPDRASCSRRPVRRPIAIRRWSPTTTRPAHVLLRMLDIGVDQFFGIRQRSRGAVRRRLARSISRRAPFIPAARIGCFGPGGNLARRFVTHVNFFAQPETVDFLVAALAGEPQTLAPLDPAKLLPDRRLMRARRRRRSRAAAAAARSPRRRAAARGARPRRRRPPRQRAERPLRDHRRQRRPDVRASAAPARALPRHAADRHREGHGRAHRRRDEHSLELGRLSGRRRARTRSSSTASRSRKPAPACRAPRR